jgi:hypothetical protein
MMQAIVKACLAVSISMGALMAGTASGQVPASRASNASELAAPGDDVVPMATCDDVTCDNTCVARGACEGQCRASGVCRCIPRLPTGGCP